MAGLRLTYRLAGVVAICLVLVGVPLDHTQRVAAVTAVAVGVVLAAVHPRFDPPASRAVGPAILIVAIAPLEGPLAAVCLLALVALGAASCGGAGMARIVPASGFPLVALTFRAGVAVDSALLVAWLVAVIAAVVARAAAWPSGSRPSLGSPDAGVLRHSHRQLLTAVAVLLMVVPISFQLAGAVDSRLSPVVASTRAGDPDGPGLDVHPGLDGGLDTGQPITLPDDVVLRVRADRPRYWRGTTYDEWDGRHWTSRLDPVPLTWAGGGVQLPPTAVPRPGSAPLGLPDPIVVTQQFSADRAGLDVLLGAWRIESVHAPVDRARVTSDGSIRLDEPLGAGAAWTVVSEEIPATEDDLRRADPLVVDDGMAGLDALRSEDDVSEAVAQLARELTADAPTTYDKVRAIEAWMDVNLTYTREIAPLPTGRDAVDHLLFESRRGYCEQIGSALVVMLRSLGIPARLAVGYVPSDRDGATGNWISRASDAHAWAEVYFPGVGWRGFDPTAGVPTAADEQAPAELAVDPSPVSRAASVAAVLLGLTIVAGPIVRGRVSGRTLPPLVGRRFARRLGGRRRRDRATDGRPPVDRVVELHRRLDRCGAQLPATWASTMTVRDRAQSMIDCGVHPEVVRAAVRAVERATFGADGDEGTDRVALAAAEAAMDALEVAVDDAATVSRATASRRGDSERWPSARRRDREPIPTPSRSRAP